MSDSLELTRIVSAPFEENTYVARLKGRSDCIVVDPGLEPEKAIAFLERQKWTLAAILNTHGHADHIGGNAALRQRWPACRLVIGEADASKLTDPRLNLSATLGWSVVSPAADVMVRDADTFSAAGFDLEVLAIPGHSAGHVVYVWKGQEPFVVFVGDVIFSGSIGRTDFFDGDLDQLVGGIQSKLFTLPATTMLLPGHGPSTTVGRERESNPFVGN